MDSRKITQSLADLERKFDPAQDSTNGQAALRQLRESDRAEYDRTMRPGYQRPIDVLLCHLDAASRCGRSAAGTHGRHRATEEHGRVHPGQFPRRPVHRWAWPRPNDLPVEPTSGTLAHYEHFGYEHATFGRRVEGLTTTPFSKRALDRGLAGVLIGAIRHATDSGLPNLGAHAAPLNPLLSRPSSSC